jgi:hypothetical protein
VADFAGSRVLHRAPQPGDRADIKNPVAAPANLDFKFI